MNIENTEKFLKEALSDNTGVEAIISEKRSRLKELEQNIAQANYRLSLQPDVEAYMVALQQRVHQRSVGLYEQLLTALIQDVLPENPHPICLELDTDKGLPSLSIQLGRGDSSQDIYEDTGGSLTNVVSSGLRFVALARSNLRKFLVLDEPDCWIESFRIPRFADILSDMSDKIGVQAILISHHQDSAFSSIPDRLKLEKNSNGVIQVRKERTYKWTDDNQIGIRYIRLQNFMSHKDTLIELGPGINVLSGQNNIGKSAIVQALRVFCYHQGADRHIMHGEDKFTITIGFEQNKIITCTRVKKGARKTVYSYKDNTMVEPRVEPASKTAPPEFVNEQLNISKLNDLDIQLSHQKMPVFLLNEPKTKQASLLSAGMEADHVRTMLKEYKTWLSTDLATVRSSEKEYLVLKNVIDKWDELNKEYCFSINNVKLEESRFNLVSNLKRYERMQSLLQKITAYQKLKKSIIDQEVPVDPKLTDMKEMGRLLDVMTKYKNMSQYITSVESPKEPKLDRMIEMANSLRHLKKSVQALDKLKGIESIEVPKIPELFDLKDAHGRLIFINDLFAKINKNEQLYNDALKSYESATQEVAEIRKLNHDNCPLCNQKLPEEI